MSSSHHYTRFPKIAEMNKTLESTFQKESPDGVAVLPPSKLAYQSYRIRVDQLDSFLLWFWGQSY